MMTAHEIEQLEALNQRIEEDRQKCIKLIVSQQRHITQLSWFAFSGWFVFLVNVLLHAIFHGH